MIELEDLKKSTLIQLREMASKLKIEGYQKLKKEYLIQEIINNLKKENKIEEKVSIKIENPETDYIATGILEIMPDGYGFLRSDNYLSGSKDIYVSAMQIKRFKLSTGDKLKGIARFTSEPSNKFPSMIYVESINGDSASNAFKRKPFESLIPIFPDNKLVMEKKTKGLGVRLIDLLSPIGKGQRGLIVAPPKVGKTTLLKQVATSIRENNKDVHLLILLIDERPEEVTDIERSIDAEVISSTFDESPNNHIKVSKMVLERAKRLVEYNKDVVILLDSLTRLTRASNLEITPSGRTLSGGLDPAALHFPKKFFGAARNIEAGGSLTILATSLIETGSRMDEMIFEEFKGTGNMEITLDRKLSEKRIFPSINILKSSTRREDLLLNEEELKVSKYIRKLISKDEKYLEKVINILDKTKNNKEFVDKILESVSKK